MCLLGSAAAPLAVGYRHTENAINIPPGKGVWRSVSALGKVQRRYLDPESSQAAYYGIMGVLYWLPLAVIDTRMATG